MKVVAAWSGGKDSCFALYKANKEDLEVAGLVTFMQSEGLSNFHGIRSDLLDAQANGLGISLLKQVTSAGTYERQFKDVLRGFKAAGVEGLVTGDIFEVAAHEKGWLERVCREVGLVPIRPLWQSNTTRLFKEFVDAGFRATVVRTNLSVLSKEWLGRELNSEFLRDITQIDGADPCGEGGEYHTVVTDGPIFDRAIRLLEVSRSVVGGFGRLEILKFTVELKNLGLV